ncbi:MAG: hypothetical protein CVV13_05410 [Gammaproteobacteria bacterium HGW-Gammaproteobacteria-3]|nr:MAG: hypothetical protein CVV13_05410 [Gammaproteobacteria bacterium HGW-Gammaproteobacteria-3]
MSAGRKLKIMSEKYTASFEWSVKSSVLQQRLLVFVHLMAVTALMLSALALIYKAVLMVSILISGGYYYRTFGRTGTLTFRYTDAFGWEQWVNNEFKTIRPLKSTVLTPQVIVLHYQMDDKPKYLAIFNDALNPESFRQLSVQLKIAGLIET